MIFFMTSPLFDQIIQICVTSLVYWSWNMQNKITVYAIYFASLNFSRIGTSRHFGEWWNSWSRRRAIMDGEISIIHSFARALCTVLLVLQTQVAFMRRDRRWIFLRVVKFTNSTRLAKFAGKKTREIYGVYTVCWISANWVECMKASITWGLAK